MLSIYICEDDPAQLAKLKETVDNLILIEDFNMKLEAAVTRPEELLNQARLRIREGGEGGAFYLLDVELDGPTDGFYLAQEIRTFDSRGFITFITTHSELAPLTFQYRVEAMDYIIKDSNRDIGQKLRTCLVDALSRYDTSPQMSMLVFKTGHNTIRIEQNRILYITVSYTPHKVQIVTRTGIQEFYSTLAECEKSLTDSFVRCHKAVIVNINHVQDVDRKNLTLTLTGGQTCIASTRGVSRVVCAIKARDA